MSLNRFVKLGLPATLPGTEASKWGRSGESERLLKQISGDQAGRESPGSPNSYRGFRDETRSSRVTQGIFHGSLTYQTAKKFVAAITGTAMSGNWDRRRLHW